MGPGLLRIHRPVEWYNSGMSTTTLPLPKSDEILAPLASCLTPEVATRILAIRIDPRIQARVDELAEKAAAGLLTESDRTEYEDLIEKADLLGIVKSLARQVHAG
jgi:hypothetical protein